MLQSYCKVLTSRLVLAVEDVLNRNDDCKRHCDYFVGIFSFAIKNALGRVVEGCCYYLIIVPVDLAT